MELSSTTKKKLRATYGDWAVVTGASSGIGKELAKELAGCGINLLISARDQNKLDELAYKWRGDYGINIEVLAADLTHWEGISRLITVAKEREVGLFVHSAGFGTSGEFVGNAIEEELDMLRLNCESTLLLTYEFAKRFKAKKKGGIILLSSLVAFQGTPFAANYAATKAYVQTFAEGFAIELGKHGIDILAAAPGLVKSGFGDRADMKMDGAMPAEKIATPILNALGKSSTVVPGSLSKVLTYSLRLLPRFGKVRVMKMVMAGMTKHQRTGNIQNQ